MSRNAFKQCNTFRLVACSVVFAGLLQAVPTRAAEIDIQGPAGSGAFGTAVAVLPNGNIVVTDPDAASGKGAVYLYTPSGALISTFSGSAFNDHVGGGGIAALGNGNFVVSSPNWANGSASKAGAVTWVDGSKGLSGEVSPVNSLVGSSANDQVGAAPLANWITMLSNGNYVVVSPQWSKGTTGSVGAVTWAKGTTGTSGAISPSNSLIGNAAGDQVGSGGVTALNNSNYVVSSDKWHGGVGAVTWANGGTGLVGEVSTANSIVGSQSGDAVGGGYERGIGGFGQPGADYRVGGVTALSNGSYLIGSPHWANGATTYAGAATWASGSAATAAVVSPSNSLIGGSTGDHVGGGVTALSNGNYVVVSSGWSNGGAKLAGAATWGDGTRGIAGAVSASNSLVGTHSNDYIGYSGVVALSNGNYVVDSSVWNNSGMGSVGAVTWGNGSTGSTGEVSAANSLVGTTPGDEVGFGGVTALTGGNYVVASYSWTNGTATAAGAATWVDGSKGLSGPVTAANSLVGTNVEDGVGFGEVTALTNGNYVVDSFTWNHGTGAVTWADGTKGIVGAVSSANSLVGATSADALGSNDVTALTNGNYVIASNWRNGSVEFVGAATWINGSTGRSGTIALSSDNSLVGTGGDGLGMQVLPSGDGNYAVYMPRWANGAATQAGAVSLGSGNGGLVGPVSAANSVRGTRAGGGYQFSLDYDGTHKQLVVGEPASNTVSLFANQAAPSITIDGYMSGNWFNQQQAGHGFQIEAATNNVMIAIWFVYAPDGSGQNWIYAQGTYDHASNTVTLPAVLLTHAKFPPNFVSSDVMRTDWGTVTFSFANCNNGTATWSSPLPGYGMGSMPITRLTQIAGTTCPL